MCYLAGCATGTDVSDASHVDATRVVSCLEREQVAVDDWSDDIAGARRRYQGQYDVSIESGLNFAFPLDPQHPLDAPTGANLASGIEATADIVLFWRQIHAATRRVVEGCIDDASA
jgi:hypothetical protein